MVVFYLLIIFLEIFTGIWCFYRAIKYNNYQKRHIDTNELNNLSVPNILIVIPCLREQDIIISTLNHFLKITNNFPNVKLLVVTTQKEEYEKQKNLYLEKQFILDIKNNLDLQKLVNRYNKIISTNDIKDILEYKNQEDIEDIIKDKIKNSKTTNTIVRDFILQNNLENKIYHLHYPHNTGIMADQLNYVLDTFNFESEKNYYFSVYNADSIPNEKTIDDILKTIYKNNTPEVLQQYFVQLSNWDELSNLMKGFAIYQSNFDLRYGLINSFFPNDFLYTYVVGHGLYIRVDTLRKIGGFETKYWCEDIYMSYVLRNKNIKIHPIKTLEFIQSPTCLSILKNQNAVWFKTSFECIKFFKDVFKQNKTINLGSIGWLFQRIKMNITWLCLPFAFLSTILISLFNHSLPMFVLSLITYVSMILLEYGSTINLIEHLTNFQFKNKCKLLINTLIATTISNIGPIYSLISHKKEKYKTVR